MNIILQRKRNKLKKVILFFIFLKRINMRIKYEKVNKTIKNNLLYYI